MNKCKHCQQKVLPSLSFCCNGCSIAYKVIKSFDLSQYYEFCRNIYGTKPMKVNIAENQLIYNEFIKILDDDYKEINLLVEGVHCGSCVWLIENTLAKDAKIVRASLNLSTKRLTIKWRGSESAIASNIDQIFTLGYKLIPFTPQLSEQLDKEIEKDLLIKISVAGAGSIAMMMILWGVWAGNFDLSMGYYTRLVTHIIAAIVALPAIAYSGTPFYYSAYNALRSLRTNMDVPISLGIIGATFISVYQITSPYTYFDAAISLIFFLLIGRYLEIKSRNRAKSFAHNLILNQPRTITLDIDGKLILMPLSQAKVGDIAFAGAGEKIAADGIIIEGESEVDNQLITGESMPIAVQQGDRVASGTINVNNPIRYRISALGDDTTLGEIIKLTDLAQQSKSHYVKIADRLSRYFTPIIILLAVATFCLWYYVWDATLDKALINSIALLIITCPCALGLAVPIVQVVASSRLMSKGIILKSENSLERLNEIDHVVFDKTGTLTNINPKLINRQEITDEDYAIISALASHSKHVLCKGLVNEKPGIISFDKPVEEVKGMGMMAYLNGKKILLGSRKFCRLKPQIKEDGLMEMWFVGYEPPQRLIFENQLRVDASKTIAKIKSYDLPMEILSGDRNRVTAEVASQLGIAQFNSNYDPVQKYNHLKELEQLGKKVLMVGDGLNDAAALKAAHVSISPSTSLEITQVSADIIFQGEKLGPVLECYQVAKFAIKLVKQNMALSLLYNLVSVPLAIWGYVNPIVAAIAMSSSSILVILNSLRLRGKV